MKTIFILIGFQYNNETHNVDSKIIAVRYDQKEIEGLERVYAVDKRYLVVEVQEHTVE